MKKKLSGIMKKVMATYAEQKKNGNNVNATNLALKYLNEDADFSDVMHQLFSNIRPMRILHRKHKIISIPESSREEMYELTKREFLQNNGIQNGDTTKRGDVYNNLYKKMSMKD